MAHVNGTWTNYTGSRSIAALVANVNRKCGVNRRTDGSLEGSAGRIQKADEIAQNFVSSDDRRGLIEKVKEIPGTEFYVKAMERIIAGGIEQLKKDIQAMKKILEEERGSVASLDGMKRRCNVFSSFLPTRHARKTEL
jgi:protein disulfide-isomerase A6